MASELRPVTGPGGLTADEWHQIGIPISGPAEAAWSADLFSPTTADLTHEPIPWRVTP